MKRVKLTTHTGVKYKCAYTQLEPLSKAMEELYELRGVDCGPNKIKLFKLKNLPWWLIDVYYPDGITNTIKVVDVEFIE